ncbi:hypothetical protein Dimus_012848, partial [Dionaea muscipula]
LPQFSLSQTKEDEGRSATSGVDEGWARAKLALCYCECRRRPAEQKEDQVPDADQLLREEKSKDRR